MTAVKNAKQQLEYINTLPNGDKPDLSKAGAMVDIEQISTEAPVKRPASKTKKREDSSQRRTLASKVKLTFGNAARPANIFKELRGLKVDDFPNSGAVLLRVFLELSVDCYLQGNKIPLKFRKDGRLIEKNLSKKVEEVIQHLVDKGAERKQFNAVARGLSVDHSPFSITLLHDYVHNQFVQPAPRSLQLAWDDARPFFEQVWS